MIPARRRTGFSGGRLLVLLAALAGLFAMHGMSDHGTMRHESTGAHKSGVAGPEAAMAEPAGALVHAMTSTPIEASLDAATGVAAGATPGDSHAAMGLCLAILAGAALLALRRAGLSSYPLASVLSTVDHQRQLPSRARAPDPPDLHALSIQRC